MASVVPHLLVMTIVIVLQALLFGAEIAEESFPEYEKPDSGGFWGALEALVAVVNAVWGAVVFLFNLITFNVPDAPWWIRAPVATYFGGTIFWAIANLIRGTSS